MKTSKILIAGFLGGIVTFILGGVFYGGLLSDFFVANSGSATGVMRGDNEMLMIPMILGHFSWGILIALIYGRWAQISTFATGAKAGASIGFLIGFTFDMINLGSRHLMNLTGAVVNILVLTIITAIVGGIVAWYLGRGSQ